MWFSTRNGTFLNSKYYISIRNHRVKSYWVQLSPLPFQQLFSKTSSWRIFLLSRKFRLRRTCNTSCKICASGGHVLIESNHLFLIKSNESLNSPPMLFYWERWRIFAYKRDKFFFLFDKGRVGGILFETVNFGGETSFSSAPNIFSMGSTRLYFRVSKRCI